MSVLPAGSAKRARAAIRSDWAAVLGAGIGALLLPLLQAVAALLEGRGLDDIPSVAIVTSATGGTVFGALILLPALRLNRKRRWQLPDGLVILVASCIGLVSLVLLGALVVGIQGGDALSALFLGGAALLPLGLGVTVGALFFPVLADSRTWLIAGSLVLSIVVCSALLIGL